MATDSPVAATFVAAPDHWSRQGADPRAIVIHMAEGGGTVSWLTRDDGNSSHYVVEYSGRVVQMVREDEAAGSMNPDLTRPGNDAPYTYLGETIVYGRTALAAAGISTDPNRFAIAIEVEGFAKDGPNKAQRDSLRRLVADIRRRRPGLHVLGHRDQQAYKPCPGHRIPWADYGGHGAPQEGETMPLTLYRETPQGGTFTIPAGRKVQGLEPGPDGWQPVGSSWTPAAKVTGRYDAKVVRLAGTTSPSNLVRVSEPEWMAGRYLATTAVDGETDDPPAQPDAAQIAQATEDGRRAMKAEVLASVSALTP